MSKQAAQKKLAEINQQLIDILELTGVYITTEEVAAGPRVVLVDEETGERRPWGGQ